tara:strand:- start:29 stop:235 length:207 start_codon:yes stop_codon:yes gene_type:complete
MFDAKKYKIIVSIILGLGIATLFRKVCEGRNCIIIKGKSPADVEKNSYRYKDKCYKYKSVSAKCRTDK